MLVPTAQKLNKMCPFVFRKKTEKLNAFGLIDSEKEFSEVDPIENLCSPRLGHHRALPPAYLQKCDEPACLGGPKAIPGSAPAAY